MFYMTAVYSVPLRLLIDGMVHGILVDSVASFSVCLWVDPAELEYQMYELLC